MGKKRIFLIILFLVVSIGGMWARYSYQRNEQLKREKMLRDLSTYNQPKPPLPTPEPTVNETRNMFDSELPQESYELIKQAVGKDFKLMELSLSESSVSAIVSTDDKTVSSYWRAVYTLKVDGPGKVNLIGDGKVEESIFSAKDLDLSIIPKITKDALERVKLPEGKISGARYSYPYFRTKADPPEWSVNIISDKDGNFESKHVLYDAKGKFKKVL